MMKSHSMASSAAAAQGVAGHRRDDRLAELLDGPRAAAKKSSVNIWA